MILKICEN